MTLKSRLADVHTISALLTGAEAHAHRVGEERPGAEHLLLSALDLPDGSARRVFERIGARPEAFAAAVAESHADALRSVGVEPLSDEVLDAGTIPGSRGVMRMTASGREAFEIAGRLARGDGTFTGAHVVVGVAQLQRGTAARALAAMGVDPATLRAAADAELAEA